MEEKKRKPINSDLFILACLTVIVLIFALFFNTCTLFRSTYAEGGPGKCMAISIFGKLELKNIDKAIITRNGEEWTITDTELIDEIIGETRIATYVDSECHEDCCGCEEPHYQTSFYEIEGANSATYTVGSPFMTTAALGTVKPAVKPSAITFMMMIFSIISCTA